MTVADPDQGQSIFAAQNGTAGSNGYGSFTLDAAGNWTYTADNSQTAIQQLGAGQSITDSFTAVSSDGTASQIVTVTIHGTNDTATIGGVSTATVQEDVDVTAGMLNASGDLTISDVDQGQATFTPRSTFGAWGMFTLDANGHWTYAANNSQSAIQGLAVDQHLTETFTAVSSDGSASQLVTVTINGTNDVTYIADGSVAASATRPGGTGTQLLAGSGIPVNHFGLAEQTDVGVELGFQVIYRNGPTVTTADTYADGVLHFTVNDGPQSTVNGSLSSQANRAAWNFQYSIDTGLNGHTNNLSDFTFKMLVDIDPTAAISYHTLELVPGGGLNGTGSGYVWVDDSIAASGAGTIGGHPIVIPDDAGNAGVTQNSQNYAFYQALLTSPYSATNTSTPTSINFDGPAQFDLVLQASRGGQLLADNHIVIDVVESNHTPVANADSNGADAVTEAGVNPGNTPFAGDPSATGNVLTNDTDVDVGDSKTVSAVNGSAANVGAVVTGTYGSLTLGATGTWTYALNNADPDTNALAQGATAQDVFTYTMKDAEGASSSSTLTINITGTNDTPVGDDLLRRRLRISSAAARLGMARRRRRPVFR